MKKHILVLLVVGLSLTGGDLVDRIAAVVNDDIILLSEVEEKLFILQAQGQLEEVDTSDMAQVRREILDRLIEERLVVQRAKSQGIEVEDRDIITRVDEAMDKVRTRFPSIEAFRQALAAEGISETMLRERYRHDIEQEIVGQRIVGREVRSQVTVTTEDIQRYYNNNQDDLPQKPMEVHLAHIVCQPVSPEKEDLARQRIEGAREVILSGQSFESVAEEVSDDPSRAQGGLLGWFSPGDLDADFEAAVDTLEVNELSEVVHTQFGFHVIEVLDRDNEKFQVRHVLAMVQPSQEELEEARADAVTAWERLRGGEDFSAVAAEMSDDALTRAEGGDLGWTPAQFLLPNVKEVVDTLGVGEFSGVLPSDRGFHIFQLLNKRSGGAYEYDEIEDQLRGFLEQKELETVYDEWMAGVRDSAYIEIKAWER